MVSEYIQKIKDFTRPFRRPIKRYWRNMLMLHYPKKYAAILFREQLGYSINWKNPKDLNEKINWLAFNTDTTEWTRLSDKYKVREFVKERGCEELLIPLFGVWNSINEIRFDELPCEFAIKTNCGSGDTLLVNKCNVEWHEVLRKLQNTLNERFGYKTAEPHYLRIQPKIIAEKMLKPKRGKVVDYKVWCFNGNPYCFFTCSNRDIAAHTVDFNYYDLSWNCHNEYMSPSYRNEAEVEKPKTISKMLEYAKVLSKGFPQVRVDFYEVDEKIYFGEMTFTSLEGRMKCFTKDTLNKMGEQIVLPKKI